MVDPRNKKLLRHVLTRACPLALVFSLLCASGLEIVVPESTHVVGHLLCPKGSTYSVDERLEEANVNGTQVRSVHFVGQCQRDDGQGSVSPHIPVWLALAAVIWVPVALFLAFAYWRRSAEEPKDGYGSRQ